MPYKILNYLKYSEKYFSIVGSGVLRIYKNIFLKLLARLAYFQIKEVLYYVLILYSILLTGMGWRSYEIFINNEKNHHSITTNDFLVFLVCFCIMLIPGFIKFILKKENHYLNLISFNAGLIVITIFYFLNFIIPSRISPTPESVFTIWFYLFGLNILLLWIIGVLSIISMPSTRLKS